MSGRLELLQPAMPPFRGARQEREALAAFLTTIDQGGE